MDDYPEIPREKPKEEAPLSVNAALSIAKRALDSIALTVTGEVSSVSPSKKYFFFTVADEKDTGKWRPHMECKMSNEDYAKLGFEIETSMLLDLTGKFDLFVPWGKFSFDVKTAHLSGEGDILRKRAALIKQLKKEGLLSPDRKRPLPPFPTRIAVVTSGRGSAVWDVLSTLKERWPVAEALVFAVNVEGAGAAGSILAGMNAAEAQKPDCILLVRGGGSSESLLAFDDEQLVRKVATCAVPVVAAIGHDDDYSIAGMVADCTEKTPTAAAVRAVPTRDEVRTRFEASVERMSKTLLHRLDVSRRYLDEKASRPIFHDEGELLSDSYLALDYLSERLNRAIPEAMRRDGARLDALEDRLRGSMSGAFALDARDLAGLSRRFLATPSRLFGAHDARLHTRQGDLVRLGHVMLNTPENDLAGRAARLNDLSPLNVLARGYSITFDEGGVVVDSVAKAKVGDRLSLKVSDGALGVTVSEKTEDTGPASEKENAR